MSYECQMSNRCITSSLDRDVSPYTLRFGHRPLFDNIVPLGTLGYLQQSKPEHMLAPREAKRTMLWLSKNWPRNTSRFTISQPVKSCSVRRSPGITQASRGSGSRPFDATLISRYMRHAPRSVGITGYIPNLGHVDAVSEGQEEEPGNDPESDESEPDWYRNEPQGGPKKDKLDSEPEHVTLEEEHANMKDTRCLDFR